MMKDIIGLIICTVFLFAFFIAIYEGGGDL